MKRGADRGKKRSGKYPLGTKSGRSTDWVSRVIRNKQGGGGGKDVKITGVGQWVIGGGVGKRLW